jgi:NADPH:quinone reductase-like Zn-dependent oxidoreductase
MDEVEIVGLFDSEDTAAQVAKALNAWFNWVMEGEKEDIPEFFEDFGISTEDYAFDADDTDWEETPRAKANGTRVHIVAETSETVDTLSELIEGLGAYEVMEADDLDEDDDD